MALQNEPRCKSHRGGSVFHLSTATLGKVQHLEPQFPRLHPRDGRLPTGLWAITEMREATCSHARPATPFLKCGLALVFSRQAIPPSHDAARVNMNMPLVPVRGCKGIGARE